jgi:hypothetical protein
MTQQIQDPQPALDSIEAPHLTDDEREALHECINAVRAGELEFYVKATNRKVTKSKKRLPDTDYVADPTLVPHAHKGWMVAAPINKQGHPYIHIYDEARAAAKGDRFGHTRITLRGIRSFAVETDPRTGEEITRPGPLAAPEETAQTFDPAPLQAQAQAIALQAKALAAQAEALNSQAAQINQD